MPAIDAPVQQFGRGAYQQAWQPFLENFGAELSPEMKADGEADRPERHQAADVVRDRAAHDQSTATSARTTCSSRSKAGGDRFAVADWQISTPRRGVFDVAYLLCGGMEPDVRRAHERELLRLYHDTLATNGVKGYRLRAVLGRVPARGALFVLVYVVIAIGTLDPANERGLALEAAWLRRTAAAIEELNAMDQMPA